MAQLRLAFVCLILPIALAACQSSQTAVSTYAGNQLGDTNLRTERDGLSNTTRGVARRANIATTVAVESSREGFEPRTVRVTRPTQAKRDINFATNPGAVPAERGEGKTSVFAALPANVAATAKRKSSAHAKPKLAKKSSKRRRSIAGNRAQYRKLIAKYARANGVPVKLALAVVQVESNYRPNARGRAGEIGLMQLMPRTARGIGYKGPLKKLYNPDTNIRYGMKYLGKAYKLGGGSTCGAILKYNAGHYAKRMNPISRKYCKRVSRLMRKS